MISLNRKYFVFLLIIVLNVIHPKLNAAIEPAKLTCEYIVNPLGIDTSKPRLSWTLRSSVREQKQTVYELIVSDNESDIKNLKGNVWSTGNVKSSDNLNIVYDGSSLKSFTRYYWRVRVVDQDGKVSDWSEPVWFETALLSGDDWKAKWIGDGKELPSKDEDFYKDDPMPLFRKEFKISKEITSARLYITGLGYYEAYLNGKKVGDHMLDPGWTAYKKQVLYSVYDVTGYLTQGSNVVGAMLGNGWYNILPLRMWGGLNFRPHLTGGRPCLKAQLRLVYTDGSTDEIVTDKSWSFSPGPVVRNSVYLGEHYDGRLEQPGWASPGGHSQGLSNAAEVAGPSDTLSAQMNPPVRIIEQFRPQRVNELKPGVFIFDMGQNFAGVARIRVRGPKGTQVVLRYGEDICPDGSLNVMTSVTGQIKNGQGGPGAPPIAWQEDCYILKGEGTEIWNPRFTFHGFRYLEVTGWPGTPTLDDITGLCLSADVESTGTFTSSNPMFNKLHENIRRTFRSNLFSVQSDCPAREKLGYGGDMFCTAESFCYNYSMPNFYKKVVQDHINDQRPLGGITETAPFVGIADHGPGEGSGPLGFQVGYPYLIKQLYDFYGDKRVVEENYDSVRKLVEFLKSKAIHNLFENEDLGDHESLDEKSIPLTASVFYYLQVVLIREFAGILGRTDDETYYTRLSDEIKQALLRKFSHPGSGKFARGTQSDQLFALWSGLAGESGYDKVFDEFILACEQKNWHLSTGIFGTKMMFDVFRKADRPDLAYRIANQRDFPGWGHMIESGATTLWETWKYSDNVFSQNHPMFGSIDSWFYRSLLGINGSEPGFKKFMIMPQLAGDLTYATGTFQSPYGQIGSSWKIVDGCFTLNVQVPVNTKAEIWIPMAYGGNISEGGKPVRQAGGIKYLRKSNGYVVFEVRSGEYSFRTNK